MKRYTEVKTQDEMGDMQDGVYESPTGEYIMVEDVSEAVRSLIQTVSWNACHETMRACAKHWGLMDEHGKWLCEERNRSWPPHPPANTVMRNEGQGIEKDFTKP